jgi:RNA polymerase sigma-70 factor (ECF subfamily)
MTSSDDEATSRQGRARRAELMGAAQAGDQERYRELLLDISPMLTRFLRRWASHPQDLDDLTQETLIAVHRARHTFDPARPLEPWLFAIARHVAADHLRRQATRLARELPVATLPEVAALDPGDEAAALRRLEGALAQLPAQQREAFELLKLEGVSIAEGAARAGTTTGALKVRAHRAYRALKAMLGGDR